MQAKTGTPRNMPATPAKPPPTRMVTMTQKLESPVDYLEQLKALLAQPKCVALGEIGLDYYYDFSPRDIQKQVFSEQLEP